MIKGVEAAQVPKRLNLQGRLKRSESWSWRYLLDRVPKRLNLQGRLKLSLLYR